MKSHSKNIKLLHLLGWFLAPAALMLFVTNCNSGPPDNSRAAQAKRGQALFMEHCAPCHGVEGEKDLARIDTLSKQPANLRRINRNWGVKEFPIAEIARIIDGRKLVDAHGTRDMPVWGKVFEQQDLSEPEIKGKLAELISYLMTIQE